MTALDAREVRHAFGAVQALDGLTLAVGEGERVALLGRNGSGKTTILRIAATRLVPDGGSVAVRGLDVAREPDAVRHHVGVVFQSPALDANLTAREALALQAALSRIPRVETAARISDALAEAGLADRADDRIGTLSGGLTRRLDLARGLLARPALALLDEPTTGLDPIAREAFWTALDRRRADGAQLIATHTMDEAERCDRVVIVDAGRVVVDGSPADLTATLGADTLWLDTADAAMLAETLCNNGVPARAVGDRVLVPDARREQAAALYERPDVTSVALRAPTLADVFADAVGTSPDDR
ncbi:ABC transporter ATP-binding protein [Rubrivirga sp. IMCC45206]|uniref:ABC transporter ATP-binding protein n=1 Tax=Rubrivirga sp. IMCC45206 TaxID=3391614 RepID=UPI00398FDE28